jgi:hypothetical protein
MFVPSWIKFCFLCGDSAVQQISFGPENPSIFLFAMSGSQVDRANTAIYEPIRQPVQSFPVLRIGFTPCYIACWRIFHREIETFSLFSKPFVFPLADIATMPVNKLV